VKTTLHELLGREAEMARIVRFVEPVADLPHALLLEGQAGIGKTSLWKAALSAADANGTQLLAAAPGEAEVELPYSVLCELLDPVPVEAVAALPGPLRMALEVALFRAPSQHGPTDQLAVSTAFLRVLRHLSADQPLLLALDDIQWVDAPSMRVLAFAMRRLDGHRVKVLAARRLPSRTDAGEVLRKAFAHGYLATLEVGPLSLDAIDDLLLQRLERQLRRPELNQVYEVSGGNPFFAIEIGRIISERPTRIRAGEPIPVPNSLAQAIKVRIMQLPKGARDILVAVAALARPDEELLERAGGRHAGDALRAALDSQVLESVDGRLRFTHPLLSSIVYSMADSATRRRWHSRLAKVVTDSEERARHLALSATGPDAEVGEALEKAARSANARGAPDAAAGLAWQAAELTPSRSPRAIEVRRILAAEYRLRAGDAPAAREVLVALLRDPPTGTRAAEALRLMATITFASGDLLEVERLLTEALSTVGDDLRTRALIERDLVRVFNQQGRFQEAFEHGVRMSEVAAQSNDPALLALAELLTAGGENHSRPLAPATRARAIAVVEGRVPVAPDESAGGLHPVMDWALLLKWSDDFEHARTGLLRALSLTEGRDESVRTPILFHLAEMECWTGNWPQAAGYVRECEKSVVRTGQQAYARLSLTAAAYLHCYRGDLEPAEAAAAGALAISTEIGDEPYRRRSLAILGLIDLAAGDPAAAEGHFEALRAGIHTPGMRGAFRSEGDEFEALIGLGRLDAAEAVLKRLAFDDPWPRAIGARCRAQLAAVRGDLEESIREFDQALEAHQVLAMPLERSRTLLAYGLVLRRTTRKVAARERLEEALGTFKALGAAAWAKRTEAELSRFGASGTLPRGRLSDREAEVAQLVSEGLSNYEIGKRLFISRRTAESHLEHILAKLGLRNRSEVVAWVLAQPRKAGG
jgi:DNA-binding CsgD family transcriptional regulator